jgi:hypothetical protein
VPPKSANRQAQEDAPFEKRAKKLPKQRATTLKSFLLLFFKKEALAFLRPLNLLNSYHWFPDSDRIPMLWNSAT